MECPFCEFHCDLGGGGGVCRQYHEQNGAVVESAPLQWSAPDFVPVETLPFFHALPNALVMRIGTRSCNAHCDYCINSHLAIEEAADRRLEYLTPVMLVEQARMMEAQAIVFAMNEVTVFLPSAVAVAEEAHRVGLRIGCMTNGFGSDYATRLLARHMDFVNVSLKSSRDDFYRTHLGLPSVQPVLRNIRTFAQSTHVEIVTPLADEITVEVLDEIAAFLKATDRRIPWHLMRLFAAYHRDQPAAHDFNASIRFVNEIRKELPYVYFGSFPGSDWVDTLCHSCGEKVIRRISIGPCRMQFASSRLSNGCCPVCGALIPLIPVENSCAKNNF